MFSLLVKNRKVNVNINSVSTPVMRNAVLPLELIARVHSYSNNNFLYTYTNMNLY